MFHNGNTIGFMISTALHLGIALPFLSGGVPSAAAPENHIALEVALFRDTPDRPSDNESRDDRETRDEATATETETETETEPEPDPPAPDLAPAKPRQKPVRPEPVVAQIKPKPVKKTAPPKRDSAARAKAPPVTAATPTPAQEAGLIASRESQYTSHIYQAILSKKYYPRHARKLKKEGTVFVSFTIRPDGSFHHLRITKSSGVSSLDKSALAAVRKIERFPPFPEYVSRTNWTFEIPLEYEIL